MTRTSAVGDRTAVLDTALRAAIRAPSPHNTQPWRFEVDAGTVAVLLDRRRVLGVADPAAREARLSCGAALFNLCAAVRAAGVAVDVHYLPDRSAPDVLARVELRQAQVVPAGERELARAIPLRRTNRRPFTEDPVTPRQLHALTEAACREGARLAVLTGTHRFSPVAALIRRAEHVQQQDPDFRRETAEWMRSGPDAADGIPAFATGPRPANDPALSMRHFPGERSAPPRPFEREPLLVAVLTPMDGPLHQILAGQAMQRVLLTATCCGLSSSFLSQPIEVVQTRSALNRVFAGDGIPHTLLRIGHGHSSPATARRPVPEVTTYLSAAADTRRGHGGAG